jgi:hypothetical protein
VPSFTFSPREPATKTEILAQLHELHRESGTFWNAFSDNAFFTPVGNGWSPAENVRHLNKAVQPLARALSLPRILLRVLFGKASRPSRNFTELRGTYLGILARGGGAGSFAPEPMATPGHPDRVRAKLMSTRESLANKLSSAIDGWKEEDLDRYRLPHPLLGKLTVREMLLFTVYHNYHHPRSVARRLSGLPEDPSGLTPVQPAV